VWQCGTGTRKCRWHPNGKAKWFYHFNLSGFGSRAKHAGCGRVQVLVAVAKASAATLPQQEKSDMGPLDPTSRQPETLVRRRRNPSIQPGKQRLKMKAGRKKRKGGTEGGASRSSPARFLRPQSDIGTQTGEVYCPPSLLGVRCACAGPKGPVEAR
jgi:hypothetical protein